MTIIPSTLIIASRERSEMLIESIRSVLEGEAVPAEIVVVDQSDGPDERVASLDVPECCTVAYRWTRQRGLSRANNLGLEAASHEILAFTHDDIRADSRWYATLIGRLQEAGPGTVVTGRVAAGEPEVPGGFAPTLSRETEAVRYEGRVGKEVLKPLNMALYRSTAEAVGGFDVRLGPGTPFPGAEDADLGFRLLEAGFVIEHLPDAVIHHRAWRVPGDYLPLRWAYGVAHGAFFAKHLSLSDRHMLRRVGRDWLHRTRRFPRRIVTEGRRSLGDPLFIVGNVVGAARWWLGRRNPDRSA